MRIRFTRRGCGLACGLMLSWNAATADEPATLDVKVPAPPALIELESSTSLSDGLDASATERIRERHPNRMLKAERTVAQDEMGNFYDHGPFTAWDEEGRMTGRGEYRFGKREGKWTRWFSAEETADKYADMLELGFTAPFTSQAEFVDGELHGTWTIVDARQRPVAAWEFQHGQRHGQSLWWFADGKKYREADYLAGDLDGFVRQYDETERVVDERRFVAGFRYGVKVEYYETGELKSESETLFAKNVVDSHDDWWNGTTEVSDGGKLGRDQRHGKYQAWDRDGNLILTGAYVDDRPEGKFAWFYANGNKAIEGTYVAGKQDGLWTWWFENGLKEIVGEYALGNEAGHWYQWTADGRVIETLQINHGSDIQAMPGMQSTPAPDVPTIVPTATDEEIVAEPLRRVAFEELFAGESNEPVQIEVAPHGALTPPAATKPVLKAVPGRRGE